MGNNDLQLESFASWALAAHLATTTASKTTAPATTSITTTVTKASSYPIAVQQALRLLDEHGVVPDAMNLDVSLMTRSQMGRPTTARPTDAIPAAFSVSGSSRVYVVSDSPTYEKAASGNVMEVLNLAGYIAHEYWHIHHGADENGAYTFHIQALHKLNAPSSLIRGAEAAKRSIVK
jgi:hypothetical protein